MLRRLIKTIFIFPIFLYINSQKVILSETKKNMYKIEEETEIFINYSEISIITIKNNQELKSL